MTDASGFIPQSEALAEASPESLSELLSRDPFGFTQQDRARVIAELREQRKRWEAAEAAGGNKRGGSAPKKLSKSIDVPIEQLDL